MNLKQLNSLGKGAIFPIELTTPKDSEGNPEYTTMVINGKSTLVKKVGWYPQSSIELVNENLGSIFTYQIGERFRQEDFGHRLWECIEEPNTQLLEYMVNQFVKDSIQKWESRITGLDINIVRDSYKLYIKISFTVDNIHVQDSILEYDSLTNSSYAY